MKGLVEDLICRVEFEFELYSAGDDIGFIAKFGFIDNPSPEATQMEHILPNKATNWEKLVNTLKDILADRDKTIKERDEEIQKLKDALACREKDFTTQRTKLASAKSANSKLLVEVKDGQDKIGVMRKQLASSKSELSKSLNSKKEQADEIQRLKKIVDNPCPLYVDFFWGVCNEPQHIDLMLRTVSNSSKRLDSEITEF